MRVALAQIGPRLGDTAANLAMHLDVIARARSQGAQLVCFPELSLTGYYLRDLTTTVALRPDSSDTVFARLLSASQDIDIVVGFVEETARYAYHNSVAYLSGGRVLHVHRKVYLPTYGMFDEQRFLAAGNTVRAFDTAHGRVAMLICEDLWHMSLPYLAWLDGADYLLGLVASPGRGVPAGSAGLASAVAWDVLGRALGQFLTVHVIMVNRVGYEDGVACAGGSLAVGPHGETLAQAASLTEDLLLVDLDAAALRRARIAYPLLRDERPELTLRELQRIVHAGQGQ